MAACKARQIVAFSGGKDSTALAYRLRELGEDFDCLFTPTGNELRECIDHIHATVAALGVNLIQPPNRSLMAWMAEYKALPNWRQRWCTRQIKIEPCIAYLMQNPGLTLCIGLRADEEDREGIYGDFATYRYPFREWGWGIKEVWGYLKEKEITVPKRTDCAFCYGQRLGEWYALWKEHPEEYARGEGWETFTGHTFRSPGRDTWPAGLKELRGEFESGRVPRSVSLPQASDGEAQSHVCRVCRF